MNFQDFKNNFNSFEPSESKLQLLNFPVDKLPSNPADFLENFLLNWNLNYLTVNERQEVITRAGKSRSILETYQLIKSYYPDYLLEEYVRDIFEVIWRVNNDNKKPYVITCLFCGAIHKPVFWNRSSREAGWMGERQCQTPSKYFNVNFLWRNCNTNSFWTIFLDDEFIQEMVGDKYLNLKEELLEKELVTI